MASSKNVLLLALAFALVLFISSGVSSREVEAVPTQKDVQADGNGHGRGNGYGHGRGNGYGNKGHGRGNYGHGGHGHSAGHGVAAETQAENGK
ncbi:glycine-rich protein DC7.1 [Ricinus communis]|uniref:Uncharacterized protein n=1 Tax=Ricinus communis TaxID=3988 RepID=B9SYZ3_RICCO|nr:glycine-rich protein DC7.1 [Ricinus communis]EEF31189.1 conserved hypothetical protein [Ricinus communis]|eukprot:XP_002531212.1 glycine-rich protein DC7.1 [Ricinus communis]